MSRLDAMNHEEILRKLSRPLLQKLWALTGKTVNLGTMDGPQVLYLVRGGPFTVLRWARQWPPFCPRRKRMRCSEDSPMSDLHLRRSCSPQNCRENSPKFGSKALPSTTKRQCLEPDALPRPSSTRAAK